MNICRDLYCLSLFLVFSIAVSSAVDLQDLLPMEEGFVVVTCSAGPNDTGTALDPEGPVVAIFNTSEAELAGVPIGYPSALYPWKCFHNEEAFQDVPSAAEVWKGANLGEVFGLTLDDQSPPNIYVSATSAYVKAGFLEPVWPAGESAGSVYRLDGTTGVITSCVQLPAISNASLGNLCFDRDDGGAGWLYISNLEDGFIYRVSETTCAIENTFAHPFAPADDGLPGPSQLGRRIWGVEVHEGRLFYALWNDYATTPQEIWSVGLEADGDFDLADVIMEVSVPVYEFGGTSSPPVSDIDFDEEGTMFLAERSYREFYVPHNARVLKCLGSSGAYVVCPVDTYLVGAISPLDNAGGGVASGCAGRLWATSNFINDGAFNAYGLQSYPAGGNMTDSPLWVNSYIIDYDGISGQDPKGDFGEVDILRTECACIIAHVNEIICPVQPGSDYELLLDITNVSGKTGFSWSINPCATGELPPGALSIGTPDGAAFGPPLGDGETQAVSIMLPNSFAGETVCFNLSLLDDVANVCCTIKVCVELPICTCFVVESKDIECVRDSMGNLKWNLDITLTNYAGWEAQSVSIVPLGGSPLAPISGQAITPIPDGGTGSFTLCLESSGDPPLMEGDVLCFNLFLNSSDPHVNCDEVLCVRLPYCEEIILEDDCVVSCRVPCCPGTNTATVVYTICNNSAESRTYVWDIASSFGCPVSLPPGAYSPGGGTVTIPANSCETILITVNCNLLQAGGCASYRVCFNQVNPTGPEICCNGSVYVPLAGQLVAKQAFPNDPVVLPWGEVGTMKFDLSNSGNQPISTTLYFSSELGVVDFGQGLNSSSYGVSVNIGVGQQHCLALPIRLNPRYATIAQRVFKIHVHGQGILLNNAVVHARSNDLRISEIEVNETQSQTKITAFTERGKRYQLRKSMDLTPGSWMDVLSEFDGGDAPVELTDVYGPGELKRFYRVIEK